MLVTFVTLALAGSSVVLGSQRRERFQRITSRHEELVELRGERDINVSLEAKRASTTSWNYLGCLSDGGARALTGASTSSGSMTPNTCISFCSNAGYTYAGVEYGSQCFCGNNIMNGHSSANPTNCQMNCAGDSTTKCGGSWAMNLYQSPSTNASPSTPVTTGCYKDGSTRILNGASTASNQMTPGLCATFCGGKGFAFAGVENGNQCFCGSSVDATQAVSSTNCNMPCAGDQSQMCGAGWRINVFQLPACGQGVTSGCQVQSTVTPNGPGPTTTSPTTTAKTSTTTTPTTTTKPSTTTTTKASTTSTTTTTKATTSSTTTPVIVPPTVKTATTTSTTTKSSTTSSTTTTTTAKSSTTTTTTSTKPANTTSTTTTTTTTSTKPANTTSTTTTTTTTSTTNTPVNFPTAVVTGVAPPPAATGTKFVWAHHMVGNTYSYTQSTWANDISLAQAAGIDGFALNFGSDYWQPARVADAYAAAQAAGFKLFLSIDVTSVPCGSAQNAQTIAAMTAQYANSSAQAHYQGKVLVSTFSGDGCSWGQGSTAQGWQYYRSLVGQPIFLMPAIFSDPSQYGSSQYSWLDGEFNWNSGWPMDANPLTTASDQQYMSGLGGKPYMPAISPFFFTYYGPNSWNKDWIYRSDDWLYARRWEQVIQMRNSVDMLEVISWNDYGESHYIGPIRQDQPMSQGWTTGMPHTVLLQLTSFYSQAFKTGSYPATSDMIYLWSRPHPKAANPTNPTAPRPTNWQDTDDNLYAVIMLASPASVTVYSGSNTATWSMPAGVNKISVGSAAGSIGASISRGGATVKSYDSTGSFTYVLVPQDFNYNYFVASA